MEHILYHFVQFGHRASHPVFSGIFRKKSQLSAEVIETVNYTCALTSWARVSKWFAFIVLRLSLNFETSVWTTNTFTAGWPEPWSLAFSSRLNIYNRQILNIFSQVPYIIIIVTIPDTYLTCFGHPRSITQVLKPPQKELQQKQQYRLRLLNFQSSLTHCLSLYVGSLMRPESVITTCELREILSIRFVV